MDRPALVGFALDVDQLAGTEPRRGADPGGRAEGIVAQLQVSQGIDLCQLHAAGVDADHLVEHVLAQLFLHLAGAVRLGIQRGLHITALNVLGLALARLVVGLAQQVDQAAHVQREFLPVDALARAVLDDAGHAVALDRAQLLAALQAGDQAREQRHVLFVARQLLGEIRGHFEQQGEFRIVFLEQVVQLAAADQHHLEVDRDRLRLQRDGADQAELTLDGFDAQLAGAQGPFQAVPGEGVAQHLLHIQHQVAAVGAVQGAGLDQGEVGEQGAHVGHVLDAPDQVLVGRIVFEHHRCALGLGIVHQDVDRVAAEGIVVGRGQLFAAVIKVAEQIDIGGDVGLDLLEVGRHLAEVAVLGLQLIEKLADRQARGLAVEFAQAFLQLVLPLRDLVHGFLELFLELLQRLVKAALFLFGQGVELFRRERLFVFLRGQGETAGAAQQHDVALGGQLAQVLCRGVFLVFEVFDQFLVTALVFIVAKRGGDGDQQVFEQAAQVVAQQAPVAGRHLQHARCVRALEIADIAPVAERLGTRHVALQGIAHQGVTPQSGRAHDIQIEAGLRHRHAELDGLQGAILADGGVQALQLGGGLEIQLLLIAGVIKLLGGKTVSLTDPGCLRVLVVGACCGHRFSLVVSGCRSRAASPAPTTRRLDRQGVDAGGFRQGQVLAGGLVDLVAQRLGHVLAHQAQKTRRGQQVQPAKLAVEAGLFQALADLPREHLGLVLLGTRFLRLAVAAVGGAQYLAAVVGNQVAFMQAGGGVDHAGDLAHGGVFGVGLEDAGATGIGYNNPIGAHVVTLRSGSGEAHPCANPPETFPVP